MEFILSEEQRAIREAVARICAPFDDSYWLERDRDGLQRIRDALASMPEPEGGVPNGADWPPNLQSVDNLLTCFDSPFGWAVAGYCGDEAAAE